MSLMIENTTTKPNTYGVPIENVFKINSTNVTSSDPYGVRLTLGSPDAQIQPNIISNIEGEDYSPLVFQPPTFQTVIGGTNPLEFTYNIIAPLSLRKSTATINYVLYYYYNNLGRIEKSGSFLVDILPLLTVSFSPINISAPSNDASLMTTFRLNCRNNTGYDIECVVSFYFNGLGANGFPSQFTGIISDGWNEDPKRGRFYWPITLPKLSTKILPLNAVINLRNPLPTTYETLVSIKTADSVISSPSGIVNIT